MGKSKIALTLLVVGFMLNSGYCQAEEMKAKINDLSKSQNRIASAIDVEKFKKDLAQVSATSNTNSTAFKASVKTLTTKYLISPGDTMAVSVYGEPEFSQPEILVRPDGFATIEPFGEIRVAGLDVEELTKDLNDRFKTYLLDPKISVRINSLQSAKVYVYGAVIKPGLYQQETAVNRDNAAGRTATIAPQLTLASVIANAGGIGYNADLRHIKVTNNSTGKNEEYDLMKLIANGDVSQDIYLRSGDSIYVPYLESDAQISDKDFMLISSSSLAPANFPVRVIGEVSRPGVYNLTSNSPRLNSAIAAAEGYTLDANKKVIAIQRITNQGNVSTFYVDPNKNDIILRPNDIVMIADKSSSVAGRGFDFLSNVIMPFGRFADSYNSWAEMFNPTRRYERWD